MKLFRITCFILCFCVCISSALTVPGATQVLQDNASVSNGCYSLDAAVSYLGSQQLVENAQAVFLYERTSETLMYAWNPDMQIFPSSLVKVLTAYMAVCYGNPEDVVTVTEEMLSLVPYDAVSAELLPGEQLSLKDLVYCMLVGSANDAASVIAAHISGSEAAFVEKMNQFVTELGCTSTVLRNPHGLHDPEQVSTVRDLAKILSAAMGNEVFRTYFGAVDYTVPATNLSPERELSSMNFLMNNSSVEIYYDSRVTGGRTGIADDGTRCMASSAESNGLQLICIMMGSKSTYADNGNTTVYGGFKETTGLYDMAFNGYKAVQVLYPGQTIRQCSVINGSNDVVLGSKTSVNAILPEDVEQTDLSFRYYDYQDAPEAPVLAGDKMTRAEVWYGNMCIAEAELVAMNSVESVLNELTQEEKKDPNTSGAGKTVLIVILSFLGAFFALRLYGKLRAAANAGHTNRQRKDRRRTR